MNKKFKAWFQVIILCLGIFLPSLSHAMKAQAAEFDNVITKMDIKNSSGTDLTQGIDIWEAFRINAQFVLPDNQLHAGDTTTVSLPTELAFSNSSNIELKDEDGQVVANGVLDNASKTITLTYTDYVEQKSGVRGEFFFYVRIDHEVVTEEKDIPITVRVGSNTFTPGTVHYNGPPKQYDSKIEKSGYQASEDAKNEIHYNIAVNRNMDQYNDVSVTDQLADSSIKIEKDSIKVYKIDWRWNNGDWARDSTEDVTADFQSNIAVTGDGEGFTVDFGDLNKVGYLIDYKAKADYDLVDGEKVSNSATLNYNDTQSVTVANDYSYQIAGGTSEGYTFKIAVQKTDESNAPLSGAVFEVIRKSTNKVVGTIMTDADGKAEVGNLLRDTYLLRETTAPAGYDKLTEDITIGAGDFGKTLTVGSPASGDSGDSSLLRSMLS
ncbi:Ig-like domain-containing protein, partial [Streptococcus sp. DD11]|uniref:Ig-like domain-containing protein n=1 Tax=Streptococcus sp. DD11 TaxID=1777879 RepID=UPI0010083F15